jgi:3-dehydroquinate synthetase
MRAIIDACKLPVKAPDVSRDDLLQAMSLDKKRRASRLSFVLPVAPGEVRIVDDVTEDEIMSAFQAIQKG